MSKRAKLTPFVILTYNANRDIAQAFVDGSVENKYRPDDVNQDDNMSLGERMHLWYEHEQNPSDEVLQDQQTEQDWEKSESVNAPSKCSLL